MNDSVARMLAELEGRTTSMGAQPERTVMGLICELKHDPRDDMEEALDLLDGVQSIQPHPWTKRWNKRRGRNIERPFRGRECCERTVTRAERRIELNRLKVPRDETCQTCGTVWHLRVGMRRV